MNVREFLLKGLAAVAAVALAAHAGTAGAAPAGGAPLKIGIIGAGHIGGTLARLWVAAGHEVLISSRHPEELRPLAQSLGPKARVGTPREAAQFGDVVSVPYGALPQIGQDLKAELAGKIVLDTGNPYPQRDGDMALEARRVGGRHLLQPAPEHFHRDCSGISFLLEQLKEQREIDDAFAGEQAL